MKGDVLLQRYISDEKIIAHTKRVVDMCGVFADKLDMNAEDRKLLINSAWLHDVAKPTSGKAHNLPENIKNVLGNIEDISEDMYHIIYNHKNEFAPCDKLTLICSVLRICDKLDKFNKNAPDAEMKCENSILVIKGRLSSDLYEDFEEIYNDMKHRVLQN